MPVHVETGTMASPQQYRSQILDHLGLVAGMVDELGLVERIDRLIPQDEDKRIVSIGQAVKAMILNGLGFANRALYLTSLFFRDKPVERLIGEGIAPEHLNDDVLGRALDAIYDYGPDLLYPQLAASAVELLGLLSRFGHLDSTGFHTDGTYNSDETPEEGVIHITKGYSRDHRPDLNQVVLQFICEQQAGIPLLMETLSGTNSDKTSFRNTVTTYMEQMRRDFNLEYLIADSALHVAETLKEMNGFLWISRVPETLNLACEIIHSIAPELMSEPTQSAYRSLGVIYGDVKQRWVVVFSPEAYRRSQRTVNKQCFKRSTAEHKAFRKLCTQEFACESDANKALAKFQKSQQLTFVSEIGVLKVPRYKSKGRPVKESTPDFYVYQMKGA